MEQMQIQGWRDAAGVWNEVVAQVGDDQRTAATPCDEWDAAALIDHVAGWQSRGGAALGADIAPDAEWSTTHMALDQHLGTDGALTGTAAEFGDMPKHQLLGLMIMDLAIHAWDLGQAIGVDVELPSDIAEASLMGLQRMPQEMMRGGGMFAAEVEVAEDASPTQRLVAYAGRQP